MVTASAIVDRLEREFKAYRDIPPQVGLVIRGTVLCHQIPGDIDLGLAPLYVAKMLYDQGIKCLLISSVKARKWLDRMKQAGLDWEIEGFTPGMSDLRAVRKAWFAPGWKKASSTILEAFDSPVYAEVLKHLEAPER